MTWHRPSLSALDLRSAQTPHTEKPPPAGRSHIVTIEST
jgi:hypothetical protein